MDAVKFIAALQAAQAQQFAPAAHLTPSDLAARWDGVVPAGTLSNWRSKRRGPPFVKVGARVLYPGPQLAEWEREQLRGIGADNG